MTKGRPMELPKGFNVTDRCVEDTLHMDYENKPGDGFLDLNFAAGEQPETLTRAEEAEQAEAAIGKHDDGTDSGGGALAETEKVTVEAEDTEAEEDVVDEKSKDQSVRSSAKRKKGRRQKSAAVLDEHDSCCCPFQDENKTVFAVSDLVWGKLANQNNMDAFLARADHVTIPSHIHGSVNGRNINGNKNDL
ncbi:hypothetical protein ZIOFF_040910 [Zingiber officinale]|uniref:Uncharacterized protein n=1 Tax=Zingiber officinale TaxID=94328 RepID=A0A8J5GAS1_ZINOF|nr:hypothetical protein ZIOFF_040910 [Zingiber officinale]